MSRYVSSIFTRVTCVGTEISLAQPVASCRKITIVFTHVTCLGMLAIFLKQVDSIRTSSVKIKSHNVRKRSPVHCWLIRPTNKHLRSPVHCWLVRPTNKHLRSPVHCWLVRPTNKHLRSPVNLTVNLWVVSINTWGQLTNRSCQWTISCV